MFGRGSFGGGELAGGKGGGGPPRGGLGGGFSKVRVSGTGAMRRVEGVWLRKDATATLPRQIVAVARR